MWKKWFTMILCAGLLTCTAFAKESKKEKAEKAAVEETEKMWKTDFGKALKSAQKKQRPILMLFTGSDWCGWCIKLNKEVWSQPEFQDYADKHLVLFKADFPRKDYRTPEQKAQYEELAKKYKIGGYPTVILIDESENVIGQTGYKPGGAENYVKHLKKMLKK